MKQYSFLHESITAALGTVGLTMGAYSTLKNANQNIFNNKYMKLMYEELAACKNRNQATQIVNRYTTQLTKIYSKLDKKLVNKLAIMQNFLNINFRIPLIKIISNREDPDWKKNALTFLQRNKSKINLKNAANTGLRVASLAAGGALLGGVGGTAATTVASSTFLINTAVRQLKIFNSTRYINAMLKELDNCPDNDRNLAAKIIEKYCYDISNNIQNIVNKSGKKINFDIQQEMRTKFLVPCLQIINNPKNRYWKINLTDFIRAEKLQAIIQHICDTITYLIIPKVIRRQ